MKKIIKDYENALKEMNLQRQFEEVLNRTAKCKRIIKRLKEHLRDENPESKSAKLARCTLKQYYKCFLAKQKTTPKIRMDRLIILKFMVNKLIGVYNGKEYVIIKITQQNIGRYLKEMVSTRKCGNIGSKKRTAKITH